MAKDPTSDLYALPLDEFTGARNALAKELAAGGDKDAAAEVRALKKPGVPAWAVNQVARAYPEAVESLFEAGALLRDAQKKLIRSGDAAAVKEATAAERKAVRDLVDRARKILSDAGHTPNEALLERVADTFYATTVDDEGREAVRNGTLTKELKRAGFGDVGALSVVPAARAEEDKPRQTSARLQKESAKLQTAAEKRAPPSSRRKRTTRGPAPTRRKRRFGSRAEKRPRRAALPTRQLDVRSAGDESRDRRDGRFDQAARPPSRTGVPSDQRGVGRPPDVRADGRRVARKTDPKIAQKNTRSPSPCVRRGEGSEWGKPSQVPHVLGCRPQMKKRLRTRYSRVTIRLFCL